MLELGTDDDDAEGVLSVGDTCGLGELTWIEDVGLTPHPAKLEIANMLPTTSAPVRCLMP
ncbi:hypothetical protein [Sulfobacillus harzensis]|uniref:Uncharacterized protein n=1 Tax=Sulfobacillus harzensis TaxID=2729629 RepID=A0A7Y0Q285_9FIRM|nr:hypothetical protein [Sulfobacillus harzensis]NMP22923.1 hypothetical protein [Sulfobacillus harzensis]